MREKMEHKDPMPFFLELVRRLESFLMNDGAHLVAVAGPPPPPSTTSNPGIDSKPH
jgi:hypothetical protein